MMWNELTEEELKEEQKEIDSLLTSIHVLDVVKFDTNDGSGVKRYMKKTIRRGSASHL